MKKFPDHKELHTVDSISTKSSVLHLGLDLAKFENFKTKKERNTPPLILWNHRWEYDKNPDDFHALLCGLNEKGDKFDLVLLGESYSSSPPIFETILSEFADHIIHSGYAPTFQEYAHWLWKADILPITNIQDFFGGSIMEAVYCGVTPILPKRLTYSELFNLENNSNLFYSDINDLITKTIEMLNSNNRSSFQHLALPFDWGNIISEYDEILAGVIKKHY